MRSAILTAVICLVSTSSAVMAAAPVDAHDRILKDAGIEPTPKGVLGYIRPLTGSQLRAYVQQLGDADYRKREEATKYLGGLPVVPIGALERAVAQGDPEIKYRAKIILQRAAKGRNTSLLRAALLKIRGKEYAEAAPILVDLIPQMGQDDLEVIAAESLLSVAQPKHAARLRAVLKESDHTRLRMAAIRALTKVSGDGAVADLRSVLSDRDDRVRVTAAAALVKLKQRDALDTLAKLLESSDVQIRSLAANYLRAASGKRFGYLAIDRSPARQRAATAWATWVKDHGEDARLGNTEALISNATVTANGSLLHRIAAHEATVYCVDFSPDGKTLVSGSGDGTLKLWNVETGRMIWSKQPHDSSTIRCAVFSPDGKTIATGSYDNTLKLLSAADGAESKTLKGHTGSVRIVAFSRDGKWLASSSSDGTARVWDVATGRTVQTLKGHNSTVRTVDFSPDGKLVATGSSDRTIKVWDRKTGKLLHTMAGHRSSVRSVAFSPDGNTILSGSLDNTIRMWDVISGDERIMLSGHTSSVKSVAYSADGRFFVSGGNDRYLRIWDADTGKLVNSLSGPTSYVWHVAVSRDGKYAAACGSDRVIHVWRLDTTGAAARKKRPTVPKPPQPREPDPGSRPRLPLD